MRDSKIKGEVYQTSALKQFPLSFLFGPILFPYKFEFKSKLDDKSHYYDKLKGEHKACHYNYYSSQWHAI